MRFSRLSFTACFLGACAAANFFCFPQAALYAAPAVSVAAGTLTPVDGAKQALERGRLAKGMTQLNGVITNESAATIGFSLTLMDSLVSGISTGLTKTLTPKTATHDNAAEKAYQDKAEALLKHYSIDAKSINASNKSGTLPPALVAHGHQFLTDALALSSDYEKSSASPKNPDHGLQFSGSDFPRPSACTFHALSPTRVLIVPRGKPKSPFEARLEEGQWRIDLGSLMEHSTSSPSASRPKTILITPQAAAFLKAVDDGDAAAVSRMLKVNPALANTPPAYLKPHSEEVSDFPLTAASLRYNVPVTTLLLKAGANVNAENDFRETALDQAAQFGSKATLLLLLAHGANVAHKNAFGKTALHLAVESRDNASAVALLLAHGANVNARDDAGETPLALALGSSFEGTETDRAAIVKLLRRHGAKK